MTDHEATIDNPADVLRYIYAGNATLTLKSRRTGNRYTYKIAAPYADNRRQVEEDIRFVKLRTGADDWQYIGFTKPSAAGNLIAGAKGNPKHKAFEALAWFLRTADHRAKQGEETTHADVEAWHAGTCGRCGRELTVPASISAGLGPTCAAKEIGE